MAKTIHLRIDATRVCGIVMLDSSKEVVSMVQALPVKAPMTTVVSVIPLCVAQAVEIAAGS